MNKLPSSNGRLPRNRVRPARAFTLVELVTSAAVMGILLTGMVSALFIASSSVDDGHSPLHAMVSTGQVLDEMAGEALYALSVPAHTATALEFTVADRTGDSVADTIRYEWGGTAGNPLTRSVNGGTPGTLLADVREFALVYEFVSLTEPGPDQETESAEMLLVSRDVTGGTLREADITSSKWAGESFHPGLAADVVAWKINRTHIYARQDGPTDGQFLVQIRSTDGSALPTTTVLAEVLVLESSLSSSYAWKQVVFPASPRLNAADWACLACKHQANGMSCRVRFEQGGVDTPDSFYVRTTNSGSSWTIDNSSDLLFYAYGTAITLSPTTITRYFMRSVRMTARVGDEPASRVETTIGTLNAPEVSSP